MAGEADRFVLLGFMARTEAQKNPRLSPACYDSDCYWKYSLKRKVDQGNRSAALTYLPDVEEGKFPLTIAERETRRLWASRPTLRDDVGLTPPAGGVLNAGSVHTPRNRRPLSRPWNSDIGTWDYMPQGCGHNTITYGYLGLSRAKPKDGGPSQMERAMATKAVEDALVAKKGQVLEFKPSSGQGQAERKENDRPASQADRRPQSVPGGAPTKPVPERPKTASGFVKEEMPARIFQEKQHNNRWLRKVEAASTQGQTKLEDLLAGAKPQDRYKAGKYKVGTSFGGKKSDVAPMSYFESSMLNTPEPFQWKVEAYHNAIKYKGENMQQWWRQEAKNLQKVKEMTVPPPTVQRPDFEAELATDMEMDLIEDDYIQSEAEIARGVARSPPSPDTLATPQRGHRTAYS